MVEDSLIYPSQPAASERLSWWDLAPTRGRGSRWVLGPSNFGHYAPSARKQQAAVEDVELCTAVLHHTPLTTHLNVTHAFRSRAERRQRKIAHVRSSHQEAAREPIA